MNYLIIILIVFLFFKNKNGNSLSFLGGLEFNDIAPLLNLLEESGLVKNFNLSSMQNLLNGEFNLTKILPLITSLFSSFNSTATANLSKEPTVSSDGLSPIKDLFSGEFYTAIENYFEE